MFVLYFILGYALLPLALLRLIYKGISDSNYWHNVGNRLGFVKLQRPCDIWIHSVSLGETKAIIPLLQQLLKTYPKLQILVTTTTPAGKKAIAEMLGKQIQHCYFPLDLYGFMHRFITKVQPKLIFIMETEIWPNLLYLANKKSIQTILINGRLSAKSAKGYSHPMLKSFGKKVINNFATIIAQSPMDANNYKTIGYDGKLEIVGNIKFDSVIPANIASPNLHAKLDLDLIITAASLRDNEHVPVLDAFKSVLQHTPKSLLIIAPRHLYNVAKWTHYLKQHKISFAVVKAIDEISKQQQKQVILVDKLGILLETMNLADIVFMGGSLVPTGSQNMLEPIALKKPVIIGYSCFNFATIVGQLLANKGIIQVADSKQLADQIINLANNSDQVEQLINAAYQTYLANKGAIKRTLDVLTPMINNQISQINQQQ